MGGAWVSSTISAGLGMLVFGIPLAYQHRAHGTESAGPRFTRSANSPAVSMKSSNAALRQAGIISGQDRDGP
jgi:hypothetical protein